MPLGLIDGLSGFPESRAVIGIAVKLFKKGGLAQMECPHHRLFPFGRAFELCHDFAQVEHLDSRRKSVVVVVDVIQRRRS